MLKLAAAATSVLVSLGLAALSGPNHQSAEGPPVKKAKAKGKGEAKKKEESGPKGDLRRAYDLLRRLRAAEGSAGRPEEPHQRLDRACGHVLPRRSEGSGLRRRLPRPRIWGHRS